jgi:NADH-quinone oxidoreductase subunit M
MLNHGVSTGALFLLVGVLYERRHTRAIADYGGLTKVVPVFAVVLMIVTLSSIGLPGTNGFVGEFMILLGAFEYAPIPTTVATTGVIFGAAYMLWMFQRVMFGPLTNAANQSLEDLKPRELGYLAPLVVLIFVMGLFPQPFLDRINPSVDRFLSRVEARFDGTPYAAAGAIPSWIGAAPAPGHEAGHSAGGEAPSAPSTGAHGE